MSVAIICQFYEQQTFSHSVTRLFLSLMVSFCEKKISMSTQSNLSNCSFHLTVFVPLFKRAIAIPKIVSCILKVSQVCLSMFRTLTHTELTSVHEVRQSQSQRRKPIIQPPFGNHPLSHRRSTTNLPRIVPLLHLSLESDFLCQAHYSHSRMLLSTLEPIKCHLNCYRALHQGLRSCTTSPTLLSSVSSVSYLFQLVAPPHTFRISLSSSTKNY